MHVVPLNDDKVKKFVAIYGLQKSKCNQVRSANFKWV